MLGGAEAWLRSLGACQLWPILTDSCTRGANPACWHGYATSIADDWKTPFGVVVDEFARELMSSKTRGNIILGGAIRDLVLGLPDERGTVTTP